ncbi:flagellar hook-basal body complex protein FliE [Desulfovirgula thermocuniculi]|uniref:flagellar hook-basal body complex protein FliE n=1 Tax=Desulfovirgula thermocuniculi TaxID=348842 RepID=UPI00041C51F4|nr:flagellar hook-basal body complex protein FliE [Desulfovirgula thermocuniculi]
MPVAPVYFPSPVAAAGGAARQDRPAASGFAEWLKKALEEVNESQLKADRAALGFLTGRVTDLHQVTVAMEEARIMMSLAVEVRNKLIEAYQEVWRMQI